MSAKGTFAFLTQQLSLLPEDLQHDCLFEFWGVVAHAREVNALRKVEWERDGLFPIDDPGEIDLEVTQPGCQPEAACNDEV